MDKKEIPTITPFNPLDKINLGRSIATTLINSPIKELPPQPFIGAGVYALYYSGEFEPYCQISELNSKEYKLPIYIGKAVPAGARKGALLDNNNQGQALFNRLSEHFTSISQASNLKATDFKCKFLVVDDIWIPLAESILIDQFKPLWNVCIDGFGNHNPGKGRLMQQKSPWDCIHEGRPWADKLQPNNLSKDELLVKIQNYIINLQVNQ